MRTVRESLGDLAFHDPIEAVDERWYEGVQEDWWHQNQMELILRGNSGGGEDNATVIQGIPFNNAEIRKQTKGGMQASVCKVCRYGRKSGFLSGFLM